MDKEKEDKFFILALALVILLFAALIVLSIVLCIQRNKSREEVEILTKELNETQFIEEGIVLSTVDLESGGVIYVLVHEGDIEYKLIEVDVFPETIHTEIEVGDTALFVVDRNWTDADLLAIEKRSKE